MKIIVENEEERKTIEDFCDIALRVGGMKNLKEVQLILGSVEEECQKKK